MANSAGCRTAVILAAVVGWTAPGRADPLTLTPHVFLEEQYNDNIFLDQSHKDDYITTVSPGLSLEYDQPRWQSQVSATTSSLWFAKQTEQNRVFDTQYGSLSTTYEASPRLTLSGNDTAYHVHNTRTTTLVTLAGSPTTAEPGAAVAALVPHSETFSNYFTSSGSYRLAQRWTATLLYFNLYNDFTKPGGGDLTNRATLSLGYAWSERVSLSAYYAYGRFEVHHEPGVESHSAGIGVGDQLTPTWWVNGTVGFFVNTPLGMQSDSIATRSGPTFNVVVTKEFENSKAFVGGGQQVTTSGGIGGTAITRSAFATYAATLLPDVTASLTAQYYDFDTSVTNFSILEASALLSYRFWRYCVAGLAYTHRYLDNGQNVPGRLSQGIVNGNLVTLYLSASYPVWQGDL